MKQLSSYIYGVLNSWDILYFRQFGDTTNPKRGSRASLPSLRLLLSQSEPRSYQVSSFYQLMYKLFIFVDLLSYLWYLDDTEFTAVANCSILFGFLLVCETSWLNFELRAARAALRLPIDSANTIPSLRILVRDRFGLLLASESLSQSG